MKVLFRIVSVFILFMFIHVGAFSQTQITDINTSGSSNPDHFVDLNGTMFFNAITYASEGDTAMAVFKLDGTTAVRVSEGEDSDWESVSNLTVMGDYVYFSVIEQYGIYSDSLHQLWRGNAEGVELIKIVNNPVKSSNAVFHEVENPVEINNMLAFNNHLYFSADDMMHGDELWISDGTTAGTYMFKDINPEEGSLINFMTIDVDDPDPERFYFVANDGEHGFELWTSNGTEVGTYMVKDMDPYDDMYLNPEDPEDLEFLIEELVFMNGYLYFAGYDGNDVELWRTDGTEHFAEKVTDIDGTTSNSRVTRLVVVDGWIFMGATARGNTETLITGRRLWKHNGVVGADAIYIVDNLADLGRDYDPKRLLKAGETIYYSASDGIHGRELWVTDGETAHILKDIYNPEAAYGPENAMPEEPEYSNPWSDPSPRDCFDLNGKLFFTADDYLGPDGSHGQELWRSEGTEETTVRLTDLFPGAEGIEYTEDLGLYKDFVFYFAATSSTDNKELWAVNVLHITEQPEPEIIADLGVNDFTLSVVAVGEGEISYQWQKEVEGELKDGGFEFEDIEGATADILTFGTVEYADAGIYRCILEDGFYGELISENSDVTVIDNIVITQQPAAFTAICGWEADITLSIVATPPSEGTIDYQWYKDGVIKPGYDESTITIANNPFNSGTYTCVLTSYLIEVISDEAVVVMSFDTDITGHPAARENVEEGTDVTFLVIAEGTALEYQWRKDGVKLSNGGNIEGVNLPILIIHGVTADDEGEYDCVVIGECLVMASQTAALTILDTEDDGTSTFLDELAKEGISVFPNPSNGRFAIQFKEVTNEVRINIYDLTGKVVYSNAAKTDYFDIDISEKSNGIYILRIEFADRVINSKIILE